MRRKKRNSVICGCFLIGLIVLIGVAAFTFAQSSQIVNDFSKPVVVKKSNSVITLQIPENPTTGYQLFLLHYDSSLIKPLSKHFVPPKKLIPGAGGVSLWKFRLLDAAFTVPQVTELKFQSRRIWERTPGSTQSVLLITENDSS